AIAELEARLGRAPTDEEIAGKLGLSQEELGDSLTDISRSSIAALDELWTVSSSGGDQIALIDTIEDTQGPEPQSALAQTEMREAIGEAIARLPEREKLVVTLYYYEELTLREIGEVLGVTESRARTQSSGAFVDSGDSTIELRNLLVEVFECASSLLARRLERPGNLLLKVCYALKDGLPECGDRDGRRIRSLGDIVKRDERE